MLIKKKVHKGKQINFIKILLLRDFWDYKIVEKQIHKNNKISTKLVDSFWKYNPGGKKKNLDRSLNTFLYRKISFFKNTFYFKTWEIIWSYWKMKYILITKVIVFKTFYWFWNFNRRSNKEFGTIKLIKFYIKKLYI